MISKVRLKNWKSHIDSEFDFSSGVNGLIGIMGSGKSSVMDSISFALFGTFPHLNSRKLSLDDLIMKKPQQQKYAEVSLELNLNGNKYYVRRKIEKGKGTTHAEIRENDKLIDVNPSAVTKYIENILGLDYSLFSRAIYSEQNNIDYFLTIPKGKRMQHIDEMLKVDNFEKVRERIVKIKNNMMLRKKEKIRIVKEIEKEDIERKIKTLNEEIEKNIQEIEEKKSRLYPLKETLEKMKIQIKKIEEKYEQKNKLEKELSGLKSSIKELDKERENIDIENVKKEKNILEKELDKLEEKLKTEKTIAEEERSKIASINTEIKLISEEIEKIDKLEHKCPTCENIITLDHKNNIIRIKREREGELRKTLSSIVPNIEKINIGLKKIQEKIEKIKEEKINLESKLKQYEKQEDERKRLAEYKEKKNKIEEELKSLEFFLKENDLESLRENYSRINSEYIELKTQLDGLEEIKNKNKSIAEDLNSRVDLLNKYRKEIEKTDKIKDNIEKFITALKLTQEELRKEFLKTVNTIMSIIWSDLYPYNDFHEIRLVLDDDYIIQLKTDRGWSHIETVSGGERSLACLALRIAFSLAFTPNLKWLILDEPTHNLDKNAIKNFSLILRDKINQFVKQIFLITHEESIAEDLIGKMYKLERDKKNNQATQVVVI